MKVDYNALAASYSAMSDEEFDVVKREDFTLPARVCYDQEKSRGHPGWHYKPPEQTPNTQRGAVEMAMHYADVIVIDVSEPSDNVIWELQTAAAARPPESILLTGAVKDTTLPELQQALKARLQPVVSNVPLDRWPSSSIRTRLAISIDTRFRGVTSRYRWLAVSATRPLTMTLTLFSIPAILKPTPNWQ